MAKGQRGNTASSTKTTEMDPRTEGFSLMLTSSDDEAPEEMTFEDSKAEALRSMKEALLSARRDKELLKEKRRKRQELFQEQKKRKLLSAEVLEEINSAPSKKQKQTEAKAAEEDEGKKESGKPAQARNLKGNYTVTTVKGRVAAASQQQAAEDFLQSRLYGPGSCRTTSNELLSIQNKTGKHKSAAVLFVKKDWALKEKAKAEKLKRRWIHKQKLPPC
ncbi:nucleolar protein 7 [Pseudoliparis swirei]|uniref:nucleolar protein 7 n=1 Tax=Pseudoliparis swirei TaxID=2059687 RepID=UPI0024BE19F3|nr:nucleolar protein 7 [Pseudoliparis swirei]